MQRTRAGVPFTFHPPAGSPPNAAPLCSGTDPFPLDSGPEPTLVVILPTNKLLLDPSRDSASPETRALLIRWGRLHAIRTLESVAASLIYLSLLVR